MSKFPGPIQKLTTKVKTELNLTYRDILRIVFSKKFVRNRRYAMFAMMIPVAFYAALVINEFIVKYSKLNRLSREKLQRQSFEKEKKSIISPPKE